MKPKVILVSTGQPSLNPRLVKEADALADAGYDVTVFYAYWNDWGTRYDEQLLAASKWKAVRVGGSPKQGRLTYLLTRLLHKFGQYANHNLFAVIGLSRATYHLYREVKKHKADLYIAHNLGALPAACVAAKKYGKPCGFDAEDFHRNEVSDDATNPNVIRISYVENRYIPGLSYLTASSPQIAEKYKTLFPHLQPVVILNVFEKSNVELVHSQTPVKLFWFSQTIGRGRGIEDIVQALSHFNKDLFELHLLGEVPIFNKPFIEELKATGINLVIHSPIPSNEVIGFAAKFDIGLALERKTPANRDLCLTNKIFTYMQAGLALIASETTAQAALIEKHPAIGTTYKNGDIAALTALLNNYHQNPDKITTCKEASLTLAHNKYNWENESQKFLALVANTL